MSREEIRVKLLSAKERGATHMLMCWDSYDNTDYSKDVMPDGRPTADILAEHIAQYAPEHDLFHPNMLKLVEVYDLNLDLESQLDEHRAMHIQPSTPMIEVTPSPIATIEVPPPSDTILEHLLEFLKKNPGIRVVDLAPLAGLDASPIPDTGPNPEIVPPMGSLPIDALLDTMFGVSPITPPMADALEKIFKTPATFWLERQRQYDEYCEKEHA